jgi:hypothetical protein
MAARMVRSPVALIPRYELNVPRQTLLAVLAVNAGATGARPSSAI